MGSWAGLLGQSKFSVDTSEVFEGDQNHGTPYLGKISFEQSFLRAWIKARTQFLMIGLAHGLYSGLKKHRKPSHRMVRLGFHLIFRWALAGPVLGVKKQPKPSPRMVRPSLDLGLAGLWPKFFMGPNQASSHLAKFASLQMIAIFLTER